MNKAKKNIVIVGFGSDSLNISLPYIEKNKIHYINKLSDATKYQGYLLIINNKDNIDIINLDKKYRKLFNKFVKIWVYNEKYSWKKDKWSNIEKVNRDIFLDVSFSLTEEYEEYKKQNDIIKEYNINKLEKLNKLYTYLKGFETIKTKDLKNNIKISIRSIERYMHDLNDKYHNIGYDYTKDEWYFIW